MGVGTRLRFELALVVRRRIDAAITLGELLDGAAHGTPLPDVRTSDATLLFEVDGVDWMPRRWVLGDLAALGRQFAAAAARLRGDSVAIVRSAIDDRADVTSLLFEPGGSAVAVSSFVAPPPLRYVYPTSPARGEELYAYVRDHRDELLAGTTATLADADVLAVEVPGNELIDALEREAARAARVAAVLADAAR